MGVEQPPCPFSPASVLVAVAVVRWLPLVNPSRVAAAHRARAPSAVLPQASRLAEIKAKMKQQGKVKEAEEEARAMSRADKIQALLGHLRAAGRATVVSVEELEGVLHFVSPLMSLPHALHWVELSCPLKSWRDAVLCCLVALEQYLEAVKSS